MRRRSKVADEVDESPGPPAKRTRTRTNEQLDRKRQADRVKHRANRAVSKTQLGNIERDVGLVRSQLDSLLSKIALLGSDGLSNAAFNQLTPSESSTSDRTKASHRQRLENWTETQSSVSSGSPANVSAAVSSSLPQLPNMSTMTPASCRCGIKHTIASDCPNYLAVALLYQTHMMMASDPDFISNLPRSPTIANYMLLDGGNPLTKILGHGMGQFHTKNVETLWAMLFLSYRMFRWRLCPTDEVETDVPAFMKPTDIQQKTMHHITIDSIPWPKVRDYLCLTKKQSGTYNSRLYMASFEFMWPKDKPLLVRDEQGGIAIHPEFEDYAANLANWKMGSPWRETFPDLHHLLLE